MRGRWCHLANTIEFVLPFAHLSPQAKWQIDRFSHFSQLTAKYHRACLGTSFPLITDLSHGASGPHTIHASLSPPKSITQMASQSGQPFMHSLRQIVPILCNGPFLPKTAPSHGGSGPPSNTLHCSLGSPVSTIQTASRSLQQFLHR